MNNDELIELLPRITYIHPFYSKEGGNFTKIFLDTDAELVDNRKADTVVESLANELTWNLSLIKRKYAKLVNKANRVPIPLQCNFVLIPLNVRRPEKKDDGSLGYIVSNKIGEYKKIDKDRYKTEILLRGDKKVYSYDSKEVVERRIDEAFLIKMKFLQLHGIGNWPDYIMESDTFANIEKRLHIHILDMPNIGKDIILK